jgi:hypothetical protein
MIKYAIIAAAVCVGSLCSPRAAVACSCASPQVQHTFWTADLVFIGVARAVTGTDTQHAQFRVDEWLRGDRIGPQLVIVSRGVGGSCDYGFEEGTRYVVYATRGPRPEWRAGLCSSTSPIDRAAADLEYIRDALAHPDLAISWETRSSTAIRPTASTSVGLSRRCV